MSDNRKISKEKGVEICADMLFTGKATRDIVRDLMENYGISKSTVEKWMKSARPIVEIRQREAEAIRAREMEAEIAESAKRLNITRERVLEEYSKIAFFDIRKIFTVDGGLMEVRDIDDESAGAIAGIESVDEKTRTGEILGTLQKVKIANKKEALDSICKIMGYFAPVKMANTDPNGNPIPPPALNITVASIDIPIAENED